MRKGMCHDNVTVQDHMVDSFDGESILTLAGSCRRLPTETYCGQTGKQHGIHLKVDDLTVHLGWQL